MYINFYRQLESREFIIGVNEDTSKVLGKVITLQVGTPTAVTTKADTLKAPILRADTRPAATPRVARIIQVNNNKVNADPLKRDAPPPHRDPKLLRVVRTIQHQQMVVNMNTHIRVVVVDTHRLVRVPVDTQLLVKDNRDILRWVIITFQPMETRVRVGFGMGHHPQEAIGTDPCLPQTISSKNPRIMTLSRQRRKRTNVEGEFETFETCIQ